MSSAPETAARRPVHHTLNVTSPWGLGDPLNVRGFVPQGDEYQSPALKRRAALVLAAGPFELTLRPTAAELRALARLCASVADDLEAAPHADTGTQPVDAVEYQP